MLEGANTVHGERVFSRALAPAAWEERVLDVGCGSGHSTREALRLGARYVLGIDVSQSMVDQAVACGVSNELESGL